MIRVYVGPSGAPLLSGSQYWFLGLAGFGIAVTTPLRAIRRTIRRKRNVSTKKHSLGSLGFDVIDGRLDSVVEKWVAQPASFNKR